jgi:hypothetical protein
MWSWLMQAVHWCSNLIDGGNAAIAQGWAGVAQAFFGLVLVAVGIVQIRIYWRMRSIMDAQMLMQRETQRPHVFVVAIELLPQTGWTILQTVWKNTGQTPPQNMTTTTTMRIQPGPDLPANFDYSVTTKQVVPVGPGGMESKLDAIFVAHKHFQRAFLEKEWLFIWGKGTYSDAFTQDVTHHVEFCFRMMRQEDAAVFMPYGAHNRIYDEPS